MTGYAAASSWCSSAKSCPLKRQHLLDPYVSDSLQVSSKQSKKGELAILKRVVEVSRKMDVSSLLNAVLEDDSKDSPQTTPRLYPRESRYSHDSLSSIDHDPWRTSSRATSESPAVFSPSSDSIASPNDLGRQAQHLPEEKTPSQGFRSHIRTPRDSEKDRLPLAKLEELHLDPNTYTFGRDAPGSRDEDARHKPSGSQSSFSSYTTSISEAHSRSSSVTTTGEDLRHPASVDASTDYGKLATVQEDASLRFTASSQAYHQRGASLSQDMTGLQARNGKEPLRRRQRSHAASHSKGRGISRACPSSPTSSSRHSPSPEFNSHKRTLSAPNPASESTTRRSEHSSQPRRRLLTMPASGTSSNSEMAESSPFTESGAGDEDVYKSNSKSGSTARATASPSEPIFSTAPQSGATSSHSSPSSAQDAKNEVATAPQSENPLEPFCIWTKGCDTGSQLRKAISHLFGRNKACTLKIPPHVWVHYCRKHYQRVRYRNDTVKYALIQIDLVKKQVDMLLKWSQENQDSGKGLYIRQWSLALRRRTQQQVDSSGALPVPRWLFDSVGTGYTFGHIRAMVERIEVELNDNTLGDIPEIEFLPDIVGDEETKDKTPRTRKQTKRKASQSTLSQDAAELENDASSSPATTDNSAGLTPSKRPRVSQPGPSRPLGPSTSFWDDFYEASREIQGQRPEHGFGSYPNAYFHREQAPAQFPHSRPGFPTEAPRSMYPAPDPFTHEETPGPTGYGSYQGVEPSLGHDRELCDRGGLPLGQTPLPPLKEYEASSRRPVGQQLPPILTRFEDKDQSKSAGSDPHAPSLEPLRPSNEHHTQGNHSLSNLERPRAATASSTLKHGRPEPGPSGAQRPSGSSFTPINQGYPQTQRASYHPAMYGGHVSSGEYQVPRDAAMPAGYQLHHPQMQPHQYPGQGYAYPQSYHGPQSAPMAPASHQPRMIHPQGYGYSTQSHAPQMMERGAPQQPSSDEPSQRMPFFHGHPTDGHSRQPPGGSGSQKGRSSDNAANTSQSSPAGRSGTMSAATKQAGSETTRTSIKSSPEAKASVVAMESSSSSQGSTPRAENQQ